MKKTGRNDPCPCGSGKKFKKCCESKMIGGRFMATKVDTASSAPIRKTASLASLFHARLAETPKKPMPPAPEEAKGEALQIIPGVIQKSEDAKEAP